MKKLKQIQLGPCCSYCPPKTTRASHRLQGYTSKGYCCPEHVKEAHADELKSHGDTHLTEADYQTWMQL